MANNKMEAFEQILEDSPPSDRNLKAVLRIVSDNSQYWNTQTRNEDTYLKSMLGPQTQLFTLVSSRRQSVHPKSQYNNQVIVPTPYTIQLPQVPASHNQTSSTPVKSTPLQSPIAPGNSQSNTGSGSPKAKKKSPFSSLFSSKKGVKPSKGGQDQSLNSGLVAAAMPGLTLAFGVPMATASLTPVLAIQAASISPDIFPANDSRRETAISLPKIGDRIRDTPQLVLCVGLLDKTVGAVPPSLPHSPSSTLTPVQLEWIQDMANHPLEKEHLCQLMDRMISKFIQHPTKDSEAIREIILLGPVLSKEHYRRLLNCFLEEFDRRSILDVDLLRGLIQLVQDAPSDYLKADNMIMILRSIRRRLEDPAQQSEENSIYLTLALSKVLDIMEQNKVKDLDRKEEHEPLLKVLAALRTGEDSFLKYQALYAFQALQWVPDNETALYGFLRHLKGTTGGLLQMSGVVKLDFDGLTEGLPMVIKGGRGLFGDLKEALGITAKELWYQAVRGAEVLVRSGQLKDLNKAVCEASCLHDPWYQWGICQLLGDITVDPAWDESVRGQAITFLEEVYKTDQDSNQHQNIRRWILTILKYISGLPSSADNDAIKVQAHTLVQGLKKNISEEPFSCPYLISSHVPLPRSSSLLNEVNQIPELELQLARLRLERLEGYNTPPVYIPLMSNVSLQATDDTLEPLEERVKDFLESEHGQVMLILGDSGAGKSMFNLRLENHLWQKYKAGGPIPLFIDLKSVDVMDKDMIRTHLLETNLFSKDQIVKLRESRRQFILICDGYDECRKRPDLHSINKLNRPRQWIAKMVITCRSQYLNSDYQTYLAPKVEGKPRQRHERLAQVFKEAVIVPFDKIQIQRYIEAYIAVPETQELFGDRPAWSAEYFMEQLRKVSPLMDLVKNPFLLMLMLDALPRIAVRVPNHRDLSSFRMTHVKLYDEYVMHHYRREMERLIDQRSNGKLSDEEYEEFEHVAGDFIHCGIKFSTRLSVSIFKEQNGVNAISYSSADDKKTWKAEFFGKDKLLRDSSPLVRNHNNRNSFKFIHRSIMEYLFTCSVYEPRDVPLEEHTPLDETAPYLGLSECLASTASPSQLSNHPFGQQDLVSEPSILYFLAERVQESREFKDQLLKIVQLSKTESSIRQAAANAITILVQAGVQFNGADLQRIQVSGADLTGGHFDSASFQGANMSHVNLRRAWLRQADFSCAEMSHVQFGIKPFLHIQAHTAATGSPDGKMLAAGDTLGHITVYETTNWKQIYTFRGHEYFIFTLSFSSTGLSLVSGGCDKKLRIWDLKDGDSCRVLPGLHPDFLRCVAYSPDGRLIASTSADDEVMVVNLEEGDILAIPLPQVESLAWSPDGLQIAMGFRDGVIRVFTIKGTSVSGKFFLESEVVQSVAYSSDGLRLIASCGTNVYLWDLQSSNEPLILNNHTDKVTSAVFSPNGQWIAAISDNHSVHIWDGWTGSLVRSVSGRRERGRNVIFLNNNEIVSDGDGGLKSIFSGSKDGTVRQWDSKERESKVLVRLDSAVDWFTCTPDGQQIAVVDSERQIQLFDLVANGTAVPEADSSWLARTASCVAYSPCSRWIASGDQSGVVRLWDRKSGTKEQEWVLDSKSICSLFFLLDGQELTACTNEVTTHVWDMQSGACTEKLDRVAAFSPCGRLTAFPNFFAVGIRHRHGILHKEQLFNGHEDHVLCVAWPCGKWLASGDEEGTMRLWRIQTDEQDIRYTHEIVVREFDVPLQSIVWSPIASSLELATGGSDQSVCVWKIVEAYKDNEDVAPRVVLIWGGTNRLTTTGSKIKYATGLNRTNKRMLRQREVIYKSHMYTDLFAVETSDEEDTEDSQSRDTSGSQRQQDERTKNRKREMDRDRAMALCLAHIIHEENLEREK
ncbi:U3 snoRNP protein [Dissophora ornata]|nr:U3 snoRNP protein [Dissophora ornata]